MSEKGKQKIRDVLQAVKALFSESTKPSVKDEANRWLSRFKREKEAWIIADAILSQPNLTRNAYYIAAYTLRYKIQWDFYDLASKEDRKRVCDAVLKHGANHTQDGIRMQLALAISGLAIQLVGSEWRSALNDIVGFFKQPRTAMTLLDILTVLPDECNNSKMRARKTVRKQALRIFAGDTDNILKVLERYMNSAGSNVSLQFKVFRCFLSWVRHGDISPQSLVQDPLFKYTFRAVENEALFEIALEVMGELVLHTEDMKRYQPAVKVLIPNILKLGPKYLEAEKVGDSETCKSLCRLFVDLGEAYMPMVLEQGIESKQTIALMLRCVGNMNKDVAAMTFNFWYGLSRDIIDAHRKNERESKPGVIRYFESPFLELVGRLKQVMQYPPVIRNFNDEKQISEYKRIRYLAADVLVDTVNVVGIDKVLQLLLRELGVEWDRYTVDPNKWHGVEACLYCFRSVARCVPRQENEILPKLMKFILRPELEKQYALRYTATLIVGRFNDWINNHPDFIEPLLKFVVTGLGNSLQLVVSSAAYAFNYVCIGCREKLARSYVMQLFEVYQVSSRLHLRERKEIIEGLAQVIGKLPLENEIYLKALTSLIKPLAEVLRASIETKALHSETTKTRVSEALDLISQAFMSLPPTNCKQTAVLIMNLRPFLDKLMEGYLKDDSIMERVCRCWKYGIRAAKLEFAPMLQPLLEKLARFFPEHPHSSFLYVVCVCVNEFGKAPHPQYQEVMKKAYIVFSKQGMATLNSSQAFRDNPDVVGDFFDMQKRYLQTCPYIVFGCSDLVVQVFKCALVGIGVNHKDACQMLMRFFATFIKMGSELRLRYNKNPDERLKNAMAMLEKIMNHFGESMTIGLMEGIAGRLPYTRIPFVVEVIEELIKNCPEAAKAWVGRAMARMPATEHPTHEEFLQNLFARDQNHFSQRDQSTFSRAIREAVKDFSTAVRSHLR